jgi:small-conductance mechanosensitive channel
LDALASAVPPALYAGRFVLKDFAFLFERCRMASGPIKPAICQEGTMNSHRSCLRWPAAILCVLLARPGIAQTTTAPADEADGANPAAELALSILPAPADEAALQQRLALVQSEIQKLRPATQPATAPATVPETPATGPEHRLFEVLSRYEAEITRWQGALKRIQDLKSDASIEALSEELAAWEKQRKYYAQQLTRDVRYALDSQIQEAEKEFQQRDAQLKELRTLQASREQQLASLAAQKAKTEEAIQATLAALKSEVAELRPKLEAAENAPQRSDLLLQKRIHEWEHNLQLLRAGSYPDVQARLALEQQRDADRVKQLAEFTSVLREYRDKLTRARTQSELEYAREQLARPDLSVHGRAFYEVVLAASEGLDYLEQFESRHRKTRTFTEFDELSARLQRGEAYWGSFMESLHRRPGESIQSAYQKMGALIERLQALLGDLQAQLDSATDARKEVQDRSEEYLLRVDAARRDYDELIGKLEGSELVEARRRQAEITSDIRKRLVEKSDAAIKELGERVQHLSDAVTMLEKRLDQLSIYRSRMYWSYLVVPGRGLLHQDWTALRAGLAFMARGQVPDAERLGAWSRRVRAQLDEVPVERWLIMAVLPALVLWLAVHVRRRLLRWAAGREEAWRERLELEAAKDTSKPPPSVSFAQRILLEGARFTGRTAPIAWPMIMLLMVLIAIFTGDALLPLLVIVLTAIICAFIGSEVVRALFNPARPTFRIIPCTDEQARYHQRWLRILIVFAAVMLPVPLAMEWLDIWPEARVFLWEIIKTLLMFFILVYLLRQRMFLSSASAGERKSDLKLLVYERLLPLLPVGVGLLLALQVAGYGALTDYIVRGATLTLLILGAAKLLSGLLREFTYQPVSSESAEVTADSTATTQAAPVDVSERPPPHPLVGTFIYLLRLAVMIVAAVAVLSAWGVRPVEIRTVLGYELFYVGQAWITPGRIAAALLTLTAGVVVSRFLRGFLQAQVFPQMQQVDRGAQAAISTLLHYSLVGLALYIALLVLNLDLGALTVLLGTLGLGLGLGLQPLFVNFISGVLMLFERHVRVGDLVEVGSQFGEVRSITMRSTRIRTPDNKEIVVPNGEFITGQVTNWTHAGEQRIRGLVEVGVAYGTDPHLVKKLLLDLAHRHELVLVAPEPDVWFMGFGENSLNFTLACWFANAGSRWKFLTQSCFEIDRLFRQHGIEIPFPQRTLSTIGDRPLRIEVVPPDAANGAPAKSPEESGSARPTPPDGQAGRTESATPGSQQLSSSQ